MTLETHTGDAILEAPGLPVLKDSELGDPVARGNFTEQAFISGEAGFIPGTLERSQFLLMIMQLGHPTARVADAYMDNLTLLLRGRERLARPGRLVLGLGSGRSGSTTLCHLLTTCPGACATHENPAMLYWKPLAEQIGFHLRRFAILRQYFSVVSDVAHWWLNAVDVLVEAVPEVRFIGVYRDVARCAASFVTIKGEGQGSLNHWLPPLLPGVRQTTWDVTYPTYADAEPVKAQTRHGKMALIARYVRDYNASMHRLAAADPRRWLLIPTESVGEAGVQQRIFDHVGVQGVFSTARLNAATMADGQRAYRF